MGVGSIAALIACGCALSAFAQSPPDYPAKPVRVIVGQAPGGGNDIQTRIFAQKLTEALGRPFVVENRTGAGSVLSYRTVASAPPDGYTLLGASGGFTIAPSVHPNLGYDPVKDLAPISLVVQAPFLLMAHPSLPVKNVKESLRAPPPPPESATGQPEVPQARALQENPHTRYHDTRAHDVKQSSYKGHRPALGDAMQDSVHRSSAMCSRAAVAKTGKLSASA